MANNDSILTSTKKVLGIAEDYIVFDQDIMLHINATLATLNQLGIGPDDGFMIEDASATWADFLGPDSLKFNSVKQYVYLRVRLMFDPPATSYVIDAMQKQIAELEWRINVVREDTEWVDPNPPELPGQDDMGEPVILDGGVG